MEDGAVSGGGGGAVPPLPRTTARNRALRAATEDKTSERGVRGRRLGLSSPRKTSVNPGCSDSPPLGPDEKRGADSTRHQEWGMVTSDTGFGPGENGSGPCVAKQLPISSAAVPPPQRPTLLEPLPDPWCHHRGSFSFGSFRGPRHHPLARGQTTRITIAPVFGCESGCGLRSKGDRCTSIGADRGNGRLQMARERPRDARSGGAGSTSSNCSS